MLLTAALLLAAQPASRETDGCPGAFVFFESGSVRLDTQGTDSLERLLGWVTPMIEAGAWLNLDARADDIGSETANLSLSQRRAETVRRYLVRRGIPDETLRIRASGESRPLAQVDDRTTIASARAQNRSVQIWPEMPIAVFHRFFPPGGGIC